MISKIAVDVAEFHDLLQDSLFKEIDEAHIIEEEEVRAKNELLDFHRSLDLQSLPHFQDAQAVERHVTKRILHIICSVWGSLSCLMITKEAQL